jgi:hypothetical protein
MKLAIFSVSLFLNSAFITEKFNREGKIPNDNNLFHTQFKGELIKEELLINILVEI